MFDALTEREVRLETGKKGLSCQHDDGFASVRSRGTRHGDLFGVSGATSQPPKGPKTPKIARARHNPGSGLLGIDPKPRKSSSTVGELITKATRKTFEGVVDWITLHLNHGRTRNDICRMAVGF